jgi:hypothetical protein
MPYQGHADGLYLVARRSPAKGVDHYGIVDIGNRFRLSDADGINPVVVHQRPPAVAAEWLRNGDWRVLGKIGMRAMPPKGSSKPLRYKGVGSILIRAAIETSLSEGFKGRLGLHSLPQSNDFYANTCRMTDMGSDARYQDMHYFEMTSEQSEEFIARGARS